MVIHQNRSLLYFFLIILSGLLFRCANQTAPTGGPKDETPPSVIKAAPENQTTQFSEKRIVLDFDEFVQLKDVNKQVIISPPLQRTPELRLRGKSVLIELEEALKKEATYTINFGKAIVDLTESNPLNDFQYIFSTGSVIDSMAFSGKTLNAFDRKPVKDLYTMLYTTDPDTIPLDSMPFRIPPYYLARNKDDGSFMFTNIKPGKYLLFSLKDLNSNYLYDLPNEEVAFLDTLISPKVPLEVVTDSMQIDSLTKDTTVIHRHQLVVEDSWELDLFKVIDSTQRIDKKEVIDSTHILLTFKFRTNFARFRFIRPELEAGADYLQEISVHGDTNIFWLRNTEWDTLQLEVAHRDSVMDTIQYAYSSLKSKKKSPPGKPVSPLNFTSNAASRSLELNTPLILTFNRPIRDFDTRDITLLVDEDTLTGIRVFFTDSVQRTARVDYAFREGTPYRLEIPGGSFTDIYGFSHDTTEIVFNTKTIKDYGTLILNFDPGDTGFPVLVQLLGDKEVLVRELAAEKQQKLRFEYLKPGKYQLKAVMDVNRNGRWDTGNFRKKLQPEKVYYLDKTVEIKSNWDIEQDWKLAD